VEVLCANAYRVHEIMVHLVEIRIEKLVMHQFVEEVKSNIFCDHQEDQLREKRQGIWEIFSLEAKFYVFIYQDI
jgi:hypothetical protein